MIANKLYVLTVIYSLNTLITDTNSTRMCDDATYFFVGRAINTPPISALFGVIHKKSTWKGIGGARQEWTTMDMIEGGGNPNKDEVHPTQT